MRRLGSGALDLCYVAAERLDGCYEQGFSAWDIFFFQAEDGIRDDLVTGFQTCALPISTSRCSPRATSPAARTACSPRPGVRTRGWRSEERRVGKECRYRWSPYQ